MVGNFLLISQRQNWFENAEFGSREIFLWDNSLLSSYRIMSSHLRKACLVLPAIFSLLFADLLKTYLTILDNRLLMVLEKLTNIALRYTE